MLAFILRRLAQALVVIEFHRMKPRTP